MHSIAPLQVEHFHIEQLSTEREAHHVEYVLSFIVEGQLQMSHGETLTVTAGSVVLVPAGVPHQLLSGHGLQIWWVGFCPGCLGLHENQGPMLPFRQVRLGASPAVSIDPARRALLAQYFAELKRLSAAAGPANPELAKSLLNLILAEVGSAMMPVALTRDALVGNVLDYIQLHCCRPLSLAEVAAVVHKSPAYVTHRVKLATGASVGQWITSNRLHQACTHLLHSSATVAQVAELVGWQDVTHFIRQFSKRFGQTPGAWRRQQRDHGR
ncbi:helix-turn-helix domain-containing protein [Pseudomonas benzenivorans]|uniref:Helix-turn-helix transcriptional regulator n=1 Tax=Pseudomonas benzenivorans TaxID=556533 RepID=A0ABY5HBC9_9PSED|nr:AraC family transcriptional regulator [Pseudomonas benzenivorans]UTW09642.1 helix-turn-helix transcriptional regulator [Pseudomonas benzenivorans]